MKKKPFIKSKSKKGPFNTITLVATYYYVANGNFVGGPTLCLFHFFTFVSGWDMAPYIEAIDSQQSSCFAVSIWVLTPHLCRL